MLGILLSFSMLNTCIGLWTVNSLFDILFSKNIFKDLIFDVRLGSGNIRAGLADCKACVNMKLPNVVYMKTFQRNDRESYIWSNGSWEVEKRPTIQNLHYWLLQTHFQTIKRRRRILPHALPICHMHITSSSTFSFVFSITRCFGLFMGNSSVFLC